MNFSFDIEVELDESSPMCFVYPQIFDKDNYARLQITIEVENYIPPKIPFYTKNTKDHRFYDDGHNFEADFKIIAYIKGSKQEIPYSLIEKVDVLGLIQSVGKELIEDQKINLGGNHEFRGFQKTIF